ncbi:MAG: ribosome recycling factor [Proteobacteria bacterium]|nr:ribosome recycling factor [Pseudomonadota bacterium]NDC23048.1 ribosome recycling factor [Pseudomonadota bacterium]NDD03715.1 ribosome recycling factor [Pseudomonadota bacterium]NDG25637.1 ribosome recycling factor [Pseudomonadota bacterium]
MNPPINDIKKNMEKAVEHFRNELGKMRVGRASATMVDAVRVDVYGSQMALKEVAALATPDPKTITIQPWDRSLFGEIEKAILAANLGLTPMNDGKIIRINMPPITEERRKDFVKQISKEGEAAKVAIRNVRRDAMDGLKKDKELTEDAQRKSQDEIQKLTDHFIQEVEKSVDTKTKEVMTI